MSVFFDNAITDVGRQLWAEIQAGGTFKPTKIVVGSGYLPTGKTVRTMTAVAETVKTLQFNKQQKLTGGDFVFGGVFNNKDVSTAFYYRELALFAKVIRTDGTETAETMYSYGNAGDNAELIPAYSTSTAIEKQLDLITYIGNDATVVVEIQSGVTVSMSEFNAAVDDLKAADAALNNSLLDTTGNIIVRIGQLETQIADSILPITDDIRTIYGRLDDDEIKIASLEDRADGHDADIIALRAEDQRLESLAAENAAKMSALWDALLTDITENPAQVNFDDLTGITLTGGVWNKPLRRLEV